MSDSSSDSVSKSTSNAMPSSASSTTPRTVSLSQDLNLNHLSLDLTSRFCTSNGGPKYETSKSSSQYAGSQSPMDVDEMGNTSYLTGNQRYHERNDCHNSVPDPSKKHCSLSTPAIDKPLSNGYNEERNGNLSKIKTISTSSSTQTQSTHFTTLKTNWNALSSSLPDNSEMNNGNKFDSKHCNDPGNKNLTTNDISGATSFGNGNANKLKTSDLDQNDGSKYKSSGSSSSILYVDTNLTSALDNVKHSPKDEQLVQNPRPGKNTENRDVSLTQSFVLASTSLDRSASQSSNGINSCSFSIEPSQTSFDFHISGKPSQASMQSESSENHGAGSALPTSTKHEARQRKFRENPLNDLEKALVLHSTEHFADASSSADAQADCSICLSDVNEESPYQSDGDSARGLVGCVQLQKCNHCFHTSCLLKTLTADSSSICCPNCKTIHGTMTGIQPKGGSMKVRVNQYSLPGYHGTNTITITYSFPSGIQGPEHPTPGRPYYLMGFPRTAYLPDTPQGQKVLCLLQEAFKRRLVFTVGTSATLNQPDSVIWNGIHHKTERNNSGGHGFPDPKYLDNVTMELAAVGVTEDNCTSTSKLGEETTADKLAHSPSNYGGTSGSSMSYGGASGSSLSQGSAYGSPLSQGGAYGSPLSQGGAYGSSQSQGGAYGSSQSQGGAYGSSLSQGGAYGSSLSQGGAYGSSQNQGGAYGSSQSQGGAYGSSLSQGGAYGSSQNQGGAYGSSLSQGGAYGSSQNQGGAYGSSQNQGGAYGSSQSQGGAYGSSQSQGGAYGSSLSQGGAYGSSSCQGATGGGDSKKSGSTSISAGLYDTVCSKFSGIKISFSSDSGSSSSQHHSGDSQNLLQVKFRSNPKNDTEKLLANISVEAPTPSSFDTICPKCYQPFGADAPSQTRKLTDRDIVGAVMLNNCGHSFHCCCLYLLLPPASRTFLCPVCCCVHGTVCGTQPTNGKMNCAIEKQSLPGHEDFKTIAVTYYIYKGQQGREHPNPGRPYHVRGFPRTAYLPDSPKGRLVLSLLKKAFDMRLIFTVGYSEAFGSPDCVTWGRISHKTYRSGGRQFGYPDPNYLDTVLMELAALGITERS